ncbi:MAG: marine proteobacterial sortase target protein [Pseudomonadota bacterium]
MGGGFKTRKIPRDLMLNPPLKKRRWWLWLPFVLVIVVGAMIAIEARAETLDAGTGELLFQNGDGGYDAALLLNSSYKTRVNGIVARTTLSQRFANTSLNWREAVYVFPLPETAAIHLMQMRIGDRLINAVIQEKEAARETYEAAKREGKAAALTEQQRPNLFTQSVANIPPGETIEITVGFVQVVDYRDQRFSLRLPLTLTPRYIPGRAVEEETQHTIGKTGWASPTDQVPNAPFITPFMTQKPAPNSHQVSIEVELNPGLDLESIESAYHKIVTRTEQGIHVASTADESILMDRDFVIEWRPTRDARPRAAFFGEHVDGSDYGLLLLMPPTVDEVVPLPRDLVFVIDTSGSMKGTSMRQARSALAEALDRVRPEDQFNIIAFDSDYHALFDRSRLATYSNLEQGRRFVQYLDAGGGTEMLAPLEAALSQPDDGSFLRQIIFITDGAVGNEEALFRIIHERIGQSRLFTVGIGSAPNSFFMRKAAQFGRGTFIHIGATSEVQTRIASLVDRIDKPVSRAVGVDWAGSNSVEVFPKRLPALYATEPLVMFVRGDVLQGSATVEGRSKHLTWRESVPVNINTHTSGIGTLWARAKIESLLDDKVMGADETEVRNRVTDLGLVHKLVTPYTSFVAVEELILRNDVDPLKPQPVANQVAKGQQVAAVMMPQTGTHSVFSFVLGVAALLLAGWVHRVCTRISQA